MLKTRDELGNPYSKRLRELWDKFDSSLDLEDRAKYWKLAIEERDRVVFLESRPKYLKDSKLTEEHFKNIKRRYPNATLSQFGNHPYGTCFIEIPDFQLADGYNVKYTRLGILLPLGYPQANPVDFYIDPDLRTEEGAFLHHVLPDQKHYNWKWWNVVAIRPQAWHPNHDTCYNFLMLVKNRLTRPYG